LFPSHDPTTRYFGVELETNYNTNERRPSQTLTDAIYNRLELTGKTTPAGILKIDGSIGIGAEIVIFPSTFDAAHTFWKSFFKYTPSTTDTPADWERIPGLSAYRSGRCGMHIHVSRSSLTPQQIKKAIVFLNAPDNNRFIQMVAQRGDTGYSRIKPDKVPTSRRLLDSHDRYEILNVSNAHTVELRAFRASFRPDRIIKNIQFTDCLFNFVTSTRYADLTEPKFLAFLEKHTTKYDELYKFIQERNTAPAAPELDDDDPDSLRPVEPPPTARGRAPRPTAAPSEPTTERRYRAHNEFERCTCPDCQTYRATMLRPIPPVPIQPPLMNLEELRESLRRANIAPPAPDPEPDFNESSSNDCDCPDNRS